MNGEAPTVHIALCIALPWLNPFSPGPTPQTLPWLFALVCTAAFTGCYNWEPNRRARENLVGSVATAWLLASLVSSAMGLLQYFGAIGAFGRWVTSAELGEAYANLRQRNQFATLTNIGLASLLWWSSNPASLVRFSAASERGAVLQKLCKFWPEVAAILLAAGNAASSSRTGLVQLVILSAIVWSWPLPGSDAGKLNSRRIFVVAGLAYSLSSVLLPLLANLSPTATGILARFSENTNACSSRLTLWSNVLHLIAQKPWFGWGWGELDYAHFVTLYSGPRFCDILDNAHNLPLHLAVELGIPVALGVCGTLAWLVVRARPWAETNSTRQLAWSVLALIGLHSMLEYPLWYGPFQMAVGLSVWLLWQTPAQSHQDMPLNNRVNWPVGRMVIAQAAMVLIAACAYVAWDYWRVSQIYLPISHRAPAYQTDTLQKIRGTRLFQDQVRFAELTSTTLTPDNAAHLFGLAQTVLHFSPEARVVQILVESAVMLGRDEDALFYLQRFKAAFPAAHARWASSLAK